LRHWRAQFTDEVLIVISRWARLKEILNEALAMPEEERDALLDRACAGDEILRAEVTSLINAEREAPAFLDQPTWTDRQTDEHTMPQSSPGPEPGDTIGRYKLLEVIGEGGFGVVFLAEQTEPVTRTVALKVIKVGMDTKQVIARFEAERQALAMMGHPNIARVLDAGATDSGRPYFVMELVRGVPITEYCHTQQLTIRERLDLFAQICRAVQHAHTKGVIHRDIKPTNVLVTLQDGVAVPKVIDFGIAKATKAQLTNKTLFTEFRQFVGTPEYMSPEQAERAGLDVDTRTDVYSLGVLLYELLTGVPPFDSDRLRSASYDEIRRILRDEDPLTPSARLSSFAKTERGSTRARNLIQHRAATVRGDLDWIVVRCLEKDRARRYETAADLASDVTRYLRGDPVEATSPSRAYRLRRTLRRHRVAISIGLLIAVTLLGSATVSTILAVRETAARREAETRKEEAQLVAELQARMLRGINVAAVGGRLVQDLRQRYATALEREGVAEPELSERVEAFDVELARINSTDAAVAMITKMVIQPTLETINAEFDDNPLIAATFRHTLAEIYSSLGMYDKAIELGEQSLETRRRLLGDDHPDTLSSMHAAAGYLTQVGRTEDAVALAEEAFEGRRRVLGAEHPLTLLSQSRVGMQLREKDPEKAERLLREAAEGLRPNVDEHPHALIVALENLSFLLVDDGRVNEAEELVLETIGLSKRTWGEAHPETIHCLNRYGTLLFNLRRFDECADQTREVLRLARRVWGNNHVNTVGALWNTGFLYLIMGHYEEAEPYLREFLERRRESHGASHGEVLMAQKELGYVLIELGRPTEAEPILRAALDQHRNIGGPDPPPASFGCCGC
jgi:serine/threonine protein kinase/tetratricopeptide (TPR) repeat protein